MAKVLYKTRKDDDPKGKPRVYFTCHPEDFVRFFEKAKEDIFKTHDCAIYYTEDMTEDIDPAEWDTDLGQMNLFVIPVTMALLTDPSRAMETDVAYAKEKKIPILPLMMETGLDEIYSKPENFGQRQYLEPYSTERSRIGYADKLKRFLESVLVSDETAKRVREAFDAYIFLSYRKKDRRYANELMRLIHKNPEYRDIAIWYDEFLTPGESFMASIQKALADSKMFALLVTPNLLEEPEGKPNFVMAKEYPAAAKAHKIILPAEMVQTDRDALQAKFQDIPDCVDPKDESAFKERLLQTVEKIAVSANDHNPEHNFLIGLAYLNGIDVEVNRERGLELITSAAGDGLEEAYDELAQMYATGDGVPQNADRSMEWREKKIAMMEQKYRQTPTDEMLARLFKTIEKCAGLYFVNGQCSNELAKYAQLERLVDFACGRKEHANNRRELGRYCIYIGHHYAIKDYVTTKRYAEKALAIFESWAKETNEEEAWRCVEWAVANLCDQCKTGRDFPAARVYYERLLAMKEDRERETGAVRRTPNSYRENPGILEDLGEICQACGDFVSAKMYYERSLIIREKLAEKEDTVEKWVELSEGYRKLGELCRASGDDEGACRYAEESAAAFGMPRNRADTVEKRRMVADGYEKLCGIHNPFGHRAKEMVVAIREELAKETNAVEDYRALLVCYGESTGFSGRFRLATEDRVRAEKILALREMLARETGEEEDRKKLLTCYEELSKLCRRSGDYAAARAYCEKKLALDEALAQETGKTEDRHTVAEGYYLLGEILSDAQNDFAAGLEYFEKSLAMEEELARETGTEKNSLILMQSYSRMGDAYKMHRHDYSAARMYYEKALAIEKVRAQEAGENVSERSYDVLGYMCKWIGDYASSRSYFEKSLVLLEEKMRASGHVNERRNLSYQYDLLRRVCKEGGDPDGERMYCEKKFAVAQQLVRETGLAEDRSRLSGAYHSLGDACRDAGDIAGAKKHYEAAFLINEALVQESDDANYYDGLALSYYRLATISAGEKRAEYRQEVIRIYEMLCEKYPDEKRYLEGLKFMKAELPEE